MSVCISTFNYTVYSDYYHAKDKKNIPLMLLFNHSFNVKPSGIYKRAESN